MSNIDNEIFTSNIKKVKSASENLDGRIDDSNYWRLIALKNSRNSLLQLTDKYLLPDYPITPENLEIIKNYRQYLRDIININNDNILNGGYIELLPIPTL